MKEELLKINRYYGIMQQLKYIHREYFELDEAIFNYENNDHVAEELADVMCVLKQFQYYFNIDDEEIESIMKYKIKRQLERINLESKGKK